MGNYGRIMGELWGVIGESLGSMVELWGIMVGLWGIMGERWVIMVELWWNYGELWGIMVEFPGIMGNYGGIMGELWGNYGGIVGLFGSAKCPHAHVFLAVDTLDCQKAPYIWAGAGLCAHQRQTTAPRQTTKIMGIMGNYWQSWGIMVNYG